MNPTDQPIDAGVVIVTRHGWTAAVRRAGEAIDDVSRNIARLAITLTASTSGLAKSFRHAERLLESARMVETATAPKPRPRAARPWSWRLTPCGLAAQAAKLTTVPRSRFLPPPDFSGESTTCTAPNNRGF